MIAHLVSFVCMSDFTLRNAERSDMQAIGAVMRESVRQFASEVYTAQQVASALAYICHPDEQIIDDRTYFVAVADETIVACGGWSRRRKVYSGSVSSDGDDDLLDPSIDAARIRAMFVRPAWSRRGIGRAILQRAEQQAAAEGFRRLQLVAMRSAGDLYESCGYRAVAEAPITLEDRVVLECTFMEKALD
jgi:GNAT superfamily N-acetyltransferase